MGECRAKRPIISGISGLTLPDRCVRSNRPAGRVGCLAPLDRMFMPVPAAGPVSVAQDGVTTGLTDEPEGQSKDRPRSSIHTGIAGMNDQAEPTGGGVISPRR